MRRSTARLARSKVLLAELEYPHDHVQIHRTRLPFIHLDRVLHFAKIDRDGQVDGFIAVYLPDELAILLLQRGELQNAVALREGGRVVLPIASALQHIDEEKERGELFYASAPSQQLAWMYQSCAEPALARVIDAGQPGQLLPVLRHEVFSGVLELIVDGRVNYLQFENGEHVSGYYSAMRDGENIEEYVSRLLGPDPEGRMPRVSAGSFQDTSSVPEQASPTLIQTYRELYWAIVTGADELASGTATKKADKYRDLVKNVHPSLKAIGQPLEEEAVAIVASPNDLTAALSEWAAQFLEVVEVVAPGAASDVLTNATREHRFVLQKAGFYDGLPWTANW